MGWKRVEFSEDAVARSLPAALAEAFEKAFTAAGSPGNAALFEHRANGQTHLYFSPGAATIFEAQLMVLGPKRANAPPHGARLAVGDSGVWSRA
jgi:hypothetical protein